MVLKPYIKIGCIDCTYHRCFTIPFWQLCVFTSCKYINKSGYEPIGQGEREMFTDCCFGSVTTD